MELNILEKEDLLKFGNQLKVEISSIVRSLLNDGLKKEWLTEEEAMTLLDVSKSTIQNYRRQGILPFSQFQNKIYYKQSDLMIHLEKNYISNVQF